MIAAVLAQCGATMEVVGNDASSGVSHWALWQMPPAPTSQLICCTFGTLFLVAIVLRLMFTFGQPHRSRWWSL